MKALVNFRLVILVGILLLVFASCEKEVPIPEPEPSEYITITLKAVANNLYTARLIIPELDHNYIIIKGDDAHTWKAIDYPFNREDYEGKTIAITIKVFIYPNGYPGDRIEKRETKYVLICDDEDEVVWNFYD